MILMHGPTARVLPAVCQGQVWLEQFMIEKVILAATTVAWLQVRGDTLWGWPVMGRELRLMNDDNAVHGAEPICPRTPSSASAQEPSPPPHLMARGPATYAYAVDQRAVHQEIATVFPGYQHFVVGIVIDGDTPANLPETEIRVEEDADLPGPLGQVEDPHPPRKDVAVEVHHLVADQPKLQ